MHFLLCMHDFSYFMVFIVYICFPCLDYILLITAITLVPLTILYYEKDFNLSKGLQITDILTGFIIVWLCTIPLQCVCGWSNSISFVTFIGKVQYIGACSIQEETASDHENVTFLKKIIWVSLTVFPVMFLAP